MRKTLFFISFAFFTVNAFASHIVGGEIFYKYIGAGSTAGTSVYEISIRLFRDCNVPCGDATGVACLPIAANISVYPAAAPYTGYRTFSAPVKDSQSISLTVYPACIVARPSVCWEIKTYSVTVTLDDTDNGYILAYQDCCRAMSKNQFGLAPTTSGVPGVTYTATIPGKTILPQGHNNSAIFKLKDTVLVCLGGRLSVDYSAVDADGDSLSYAFAPAYDGGIFYASGCIFTSSTGTVCEDYLGAGPPPYNAITYNEDLGFSGNQPLGAGTQINPATGLISGFAPEVAGRYIVNVVVNEWRRGKKIATHQKDFIIRVEDCGLAAPKLDPYAENCKTFDLTFENKSTSPLVHSYYWNFGDFKTTDSISAEPRAEHTFSDTGVYTITLITNKGLDCADTATMLAKVYPGFAADFAVTSGCVTTPYTFTDLTTSKYGTVNSWRWDFGDFKTTADTSLVQNPQYLYSAVQQASPKLIVGDSKGCLDTISKLITVNDKLQLHLAFKDSLICLKDTVQLNMAEPLPAATTITWSPLVNISNAGIANPFVYPGSTMVYYVAIHDNNCSNNDSVTIRVIASVTVDAGADTTICMGDSIQVFPVTNAAGFTWSPAAGIDNVNAKNPFIKPVASAYYRVIAKAGSCSATDSIQVSTVPYPKVTSAPDTTICLGKTVKLYANTTAAAFTWSPANSLLQPNTLTPVAGPQLTTAYIITVTDTLGCPKPVSDTTIVTVSHATAFAGNDTAVVAGQPLQLGATGSGTSYKWSPAFGMDNTNIANPVVTLGIQYDSVIYRVTVSTIEGCTASDGIKVVVFKTRPDIFVPSAFTPNGDRLNDVLHPKPVGIKQFNYFRIYNRYGQIVFNTSAIGEGWDGNFNGTKQPAGAYVYMAQGLDYTGRIISKKGTIVLIR